MPMPTTVLDLDTNEEATRVKYSSYDATIEYNIFLELPDRDPETHPWHIEARAVDSIKRNPEISDG
jgi:hypothetical protein